MFNPLAARDKIFHFAEPVCFAKDVISCFYKSFVCLLRKNYIYESSMPRNKLFFFLYDFQKDQRLYFFHIICDSNLLF